MTGRVKLGAACVFIIAAFIADLSVNPGGSGVTRYIDDITQAAAAAAAAAAAGWRATRESGRLRLSWALLAGGTAAWAMGQSVWTYYELGLKESAPFPSFADVGYLLLPVLAIAGMLVRPSDAFSGRGRWRITLDAMLIIASLFTISWGTTLGEVYRGGDGSLFARSVALAYPAGDLALLAIVVTVVSYAHSGGRLGITYIGSGLAALAIADSGFAYLTAIGRYQTGDLIDAAWVSGFIIIAFAACVDRADGWTTNRSRTPHATTIMPYIPAIGAIGFGMWQLAGGTSNDRPLGVATAFLVVVLLVRQIVVVLDNSDLADQMKHQAFHDVLTGLANRALFNDRLGHALELRRRDGRPVAVLLIDLDDFKIVNDTFGHPIGDELLIDVATRLSGSARSADTIARLGGDEFAILMEDGGRPHELARRVLDQMQRPFRLGVRTVSVTCSIGIATLESGGIDRDTTDLLHQADLAMYAAKHSGKGVAEVYSADLVSLDSVSGDMRAALMNDIIREHINFALQPIFRSDGALYSVEALARWSYDGEPVSPSRFLPIARELDCLAAIDEIVLRKAVAAVAPFDDIGLAVNVDGRTLTCTGFVKHVESVLREHDFAPSRLAIEVLELELIEQNEVALDTLQELRGIGVRVAVDDFGAGYATLARLKALRPDVLKIDRSLIVDSDKDGTAALLFDSAVRLGRVLGAQVVAEGVETRPQLGTALTAGCDAIQGFLLGRPTSPDELASLVARGTVARHPLVNDADAGMSYGRIAR